MNAIHDSTRTQQWFVYNDRYAIAAHLIKRNNEGQWWACVAQGYRHTNRAHTMTDAYRPARPTDTRCRACTLHQNDERPRNGFLR